MIIFQNTKSLNTIRNDAQLTVGFLLSGILLMMIFFTAANYFIVEKERIFIQLLLFDLHVLPYFLHTFLKGKAACLSSLFQ